MGLTQHLPAWVDIVRQSWEAQHMPPVHTNSGNSTPPSPSADAFRSYIDSSAQSALLAVLDQEVKVLVEQFVLENKDLIAALTRQILDGSLKRIAAEAQAEPG